MKELTQDSLNDIVLGAAEVARGLLVKTGKVEPMAFILDRDLDLVPLSLHNIQRLLGKGYERLRVNQLWVGVAMLAKTLGARAVMGVNDVRFKTLTASEAEMEEIRKRRFKPGEIADDPQYQEAIVIIAKAPGLTPPFCMMPYRRLGSVCVFDDFEGPKLVTDLKGLEINVIPDFWTL